MLLDVTTFRSYAKAVRFEWDEAKRKSNAEKHGIDFAGIESVFAGVTVTVAGKRFDYPEPRFVRLGLLSGRVVVIAHTESDEVIRIISVRKATKNEEMRYDKEIAD